MKQNQLSRRSFFSQFGKYTGLLVASPLLLKVFPAIAEERRRGGGAAAATGPDWANPNEGPAKAVKYVEDKAKADPSIKMDRSGVKYADQFCHNCKWYTKPVVKKRRQRGRSVHHRRKQSCASGWDLWELDENLINWPL